jgi:glyoxalase family protein
MKLNGIHHITAITADAPGNVDFYSRVLGLRLVKKSVNQDDPTVYHLFYGDEHAQPGADLTFFEYPHTERGSAGAGMVHTVIWRVGSDAALDFWADRFAGEGVEHRREGSVLRFQDPEGLAHELITEDDGNEPLTADFHEIPGEFALQGFAGARAYGLHLDKTEEVVVGLMNFERTGQSEDGAVEFTAAGDKRSSRYIVEPTTIAGVYGAGTVHHIAWWSNDDEHEAWQQHLTGHGMFPTPVIDRHYFRSIYYREPGGVLFELATGSPGFAVDEPAEHLGERLSLPPKFEPLREELEQRLTPLPNPRLAPR